MKPNVTIRIACPGSDDIAAESHEGPTTNILLTVDEDWFENPTSRDNDDGIIIELPEHIQEAFAAMLRSNRNRIEIMEGITKYSCYRTPRGSVDTAKQEYEAQNLNRHGAGSLPDDKISKVCFEPCPDKRATQEHCDDCPVAEFKRREVEHARVYEKQHSPALLCGSGCPTPAYCTQNDCCQKLEVKIPDLPQVDPNTLACGSCCPCPRKCDQVGCVAKQQGII